MDEFEKKGLGLYIHIPFCVRKCAYCDFFSFPTGDEMRHRYADALIREISARAEEFPGTQVDTVYIGGGTPSLMDAQDLIQIFQTLRDSFQIRSNAEITMEMNPGTVSQEKARLLRPYINRISLGVQSFRDAELKALGRIHTAAGAEEAVDILRSAGYGNISLDLMYGIPGQTLQTWKQTLEKAAKLQPCHISAYSLIIEEGTPFFSMYGNKGLTSSGESSSRQPEETPLCETKQSDTPAALPSEEEESAMADLAGVFLAEHGFRQYEISNYACPGYESRHNIRYWKRREYLGLGAGASSLAGYRRWRNTRNIGLYLEKSGSPECLVREEEILEERAEMEEFMFLGLRMTEGITEADFRNLFGRELKDVYGKQIAGQLDKGFLTTDGNGRYAFTKRGMEVSNILLAEYL